jgi:hypothetical protein
VLLCAHYDSVAAGPGAGDDGAGVGALLEIARALTTDPKWTRPIIFLFDDAEELGLIGAHAFVREHPWASDVAFVINLEARGTSGPSMMFETSEENLGLMQVYARAVKRPVAVSVAYEIYKRLPNDTDLTVFKAAGMRGFNFAFIGGLRHYHTPLDDLAHLSPESVQHHGDNALALARALSASDAEPTATGRAVYTDVFGAGMIVWPEGASIGIALVACAVLGLSMFRRARAGVSAASIGWGALSALLCVVGAGLIGWLVVQVAHWLRDAPEPWAAHPEALRLSIVSATIALALLVSRTRPAARAGFEGQFFGAWAFFAGAGTLIAALAPSACYVFVFPSALAALCALIWSFLSDEARERKRETLVLAPLVPLCAMWFPLAIGIELSFELHAAVAIAAAYGVALAAAAPLMTRASARQASFALRGSIALTLGSLCAALAVPAYSAEQPEALNLVHFQDVDAARATWSAHAFSRSSRGMARLAPTDRTPPASWLASDSPEGEYAAPTWAAAPPELVVLESIGNDASTRRVRARVQSKRGARLIGLELPKAARMIAASWNGHALHDLPEDDGPVFAALGDDFVELEFDISSRDPVEIHVFDVDAMLPESAADLLSARPAHRVPRSHGDGSIVRRRATL